MSSYQDPLDSPLNNDQPGLRPETPALENLLDYATHNALIRCNVMMPARVIAKTSDQLVDVQPLPKTLYTTDTDPVAKPPLSDVPVAMTMGAKWSIRTPVDVGDLGYLLFADRSIEAYLDGDGQSPYSPADTRLHDLADAVFVPGLCTTQQQTTENNTDMVLTNGDMQVRLTQSGNLKLTNGKSDVLDLVDQLCTVLATQFFTNTLIGPQPPLASTVAAVQQIQQSLATLRGGQ